MIAEKLPPWSYSFLHSYDVCQHQAYRTYVKKDIEFISSPQSDYGTSVHKALEARFKGEKLPAEYVDYESYVRPIESFPTEEKHYEWKLGILEDGSSCNFYDEDVWGRGVLDVCMINGPTAMLFDWKTGKIREDPTELELHAILVKAHRPYLTKILGRYMWLKFNKLGLVHDLSDTVVKLAYVRGVMERAKQNFRVGAWQRHENVLCKWCAVIDCPFNKRNEPMKRNGQ
jgi:hypothetical protein